MGLFSELFQKELIFTNIEIGDKKDFFETIASSLEKAGYVKETFQDAISAREEVFPTGLETGAYQVAIPHTDPQHVVKPFIAMVKPKSPVSFIQMGADDKEVKAEMIFVLGLTKADGQTTLLQSLIDVFMNQELMDKLSGCNDKEYLYELLVNNIDSKGGVYL